MHGPMNVKEIKNIVPFASARYSLLLSRGTVYFAHDLPKPFKFSKRGSLIACKIKVKCTLVQTLRLCTGRTAHRGSRGIALPFLEHGIRRGEGLASRPGRSLPPGKTRYPLYRKLGGTQGRSGQVRKVSPPTGIRSPDRPARNQSLYRLRYPAHFIACGQC